MNTIQTHFRISLALAALLLTIGLTALAPLATAAEGDFSKPVIDIGMVVKDSERTAQFLTNVVGFKEVRGFSVNAEVARKIGLVDGYPAEVRVFMLEGTEPATRIKVLSFPKAQGKQADQAFIHSTLGFRYQMCQRSISSRPSNLVPRPMV